MRLLLTAAATAVVLAAPLRAQDVVRRVTLDEAVQLAVRSQPAMVQARQDLRVADADVRQRTAAFLPSLTASGNTNKSSSTRIDATTGLPVTTNSQYSSSLGINASWDVFTGLRRGAQRSASNATADQREATVQRQEYAVVLSTKQAFYLALANGALVGVQQTRLRGADEQLKLTTERLRLGATTRSDSLRARVEYGNAQLALINAQNSLRNAQAALARQIQIEGLVMAVYDTALEARVRVDTATLMREAFASAPSVREADAAVSAARATKNASKSTYMPTVNLSGGYNYAASDRIVWGGQYLPTWNVRLGFNYPLFNNLTRETSVVTADANVQSSMARARDARLAVSTSLTQFISALDAAAARIDVSLVSVVAAEEDLRMQRERYRLGAVTIIEVLTSQGNLDQAQVDLIQARFDYVVAKAQIEALVGRSL